MSIENFTSNEEKEENYLSEQVENYIKEKILSKLKRNHREELLEKKGVNVDLYVRKVIKEGREEFDVSINTIDGLPKIEIENSDVFIYFCKLHGFIPRLNKIYFEGIDIVSKIKELETFFLLGLQDGEFNIGVWGELSKISDSIKDFFREKYDKDMNYSIPELSRIVWQFQRLFIEIPNDLKKINGNKFNRDNTKGTLLENIFAEIALRTEDQIRNQIGIFSTYLVGASLEQDKKEKTDLVWTLKRDNLEPYSNIPIQFTIENTKRARISNYRKTSNKVDDIEFYLANEKKNGVLESPFVTIFVNGKFRDSAGLSGPLGLVEQYNSWLSNNGNIRERQDTEKFPFFINSVDPRIISGPEIIYFILHVIFKTNIFEGDQRNKNVLKERASNIQRKLEQFLESIPSDRVKLGNGNVYIEKLSFEIQGHIVNKKDHNKQNVILNKFFIDIYYKGEYLGAILIHK